MLFFNLNLYNKYYFFENIISKINISLIKNKYLKFNVWEV